MKTISEQSIETGHGHSFLEHAEGEFSHTLLIWFPKEHPPLNAILRRLGNLKGWKARKVAADRAKRWFKSKLAVALIGLRERAPRTRVRLTIHSFRHRLADYDGLVGGAKYLVDILVHEELLVDDSPDWVAKPTYDQSIDRTRRRTEITIEYFRKETP